LTCNFDFAMSFIRRQVNQVAHAKASLSRDNLIFSMIYLG